jgi:hypothetical protein
MDYLTLALCISIGTGVPWLVAVYSDNGARKLIGNTLFSMMGTVASAGLFHWTSPTYAIIALVSVGPVVALLAIAAAQAAKRAIASRWMPQSSV